MLTLALATLVMTAQPGAGAPDAATPAPLVRSSTLLALPSADEDIRRALLQSHAQQPERRVCTLQVLTGSRQPRQICGTLREWFQQRTPAEVQADEAPWQLVEEIKRQRRKANMRPRG